MRKGTSVFQANDVISSLEREDPCEFPGLRVGVPTSRDGPGGRAIAQFAVDEHFRRSRFGGSIADFHLVVAARFERHVVLGKVRLFSLFHQHADSFAVASRHFENIASREVFRFDDSGGASANRLRIGADGTRVLEVFGLFQSRP